MKATRAACVTALLALAGCGSRSGLLLDGIAGSGGAGGSTATGSPACDLHLSHRPLPATAPGALCTKGPGALQGTTMWAVRRRQLDAFTADGAASQHAFFPGDALPAWYESARAVAARGEWVFAADAESQVGEKGSGKAAAQMIIADRSGKIAAKRAIPVSSAPNFTDLQITANDGGLMVYSFQAYPAVHALEILSPSGDVLTSAQDLDPITDPDDSGFVAVRESESPEVRTYWLSACTGERRETLESQRKLRGTAVSWGRFLVYVDPDQNTLAVEGEEGATHLDLGVPAGAPMPSIFDFHPSGWALVTTQETLRFTAIHAGTGERHSLSITLPKGYSRYPTYTGAFGPEQFDSNARELRVTSQGGLLLPLRSASLGYLFTSLDGQTWGALGTPIGQVYTALGVEAGGSFVHIGNAYSVTLPEWDPPPPGVVRLDYQSTQLIRPAAGQSLVVEQSPKNQFYNHLYRLSRDGGCLETSLVGGDGVTWNNAVTGETFSFPPGGPQEDSLLPAGEWVTSGDVDAASLL